MRAPRLLCATGTFAHEPGHTDFRRILHYGPEVDAEGFEVLVFRAWTDDDLRAIAPALVRSGLRFGAVHASKDIGALLGRDDEAQTEGLRRLGANCRFAAAIGAAVVVLHLWDLPESDDDFERNLAALLRALDEAAATGVALAIETIPCRRRDPLSNVRACLEADGRSAVALDTEFLAMHRQLEASVEAEWLWQDGRTRHVHLKDYDGVPFAPDGRRRFLPPGAGGIAFPDLFAGLARRGFHGTFSLEAAFLDTQGRTDVPALNRCLGELRHLIEAAYGTESGPG